MLTLMKLTKKLNHVWIYKKDSAFNDYILWTVRIPCNCRLFFVLRGLVLNTKLQHGQCLPSHHTKISHIEHIFCTCMYRLIPWTLFALCWGQIPLHTIMELYQKIRFMNLRKLFYLIKITQNPPNVTPHQPNVTLVWNVRNWWKRPKM